MSYFAPSEIQRLPPALMGLCVGQHFDDYGRMQQVTREEMRAATGRQLLQMALGIGTDRLS